MTETVVITGASAGIGRATARLYGGRGANVALIARGEAGLEGAVRLGLGVRGLQRENEGHQSLGHIAPTVNSKPPGPIRRNNNALGAPSFSLREGGDFDFDWFRNRSHF